VNNILAHFFSTEDQTMTSPKKTPPVVKFFRITFSYAGDTYAVIPLQPDPAVARKGFRLRKESGDRQVYDVRVSEGGPECDCKGFLFRHRCKHIGMLQAARMLD
jgi:hypothetical protein